jgi:hypothetical protein
MHKDRNWEITRIYGVRSNSPTFAKTQETAFFLPISASLPEQSGRRTIGVDDKNRRKAMKENQPPRRECADLGAQYGKIGISAVAAAVRYKGEARNPAYAPVTPDARAEDGESDVSQLR